jgi:hypothetical protein
VITTTYFNFVWLKKDAAYELSSLRWPSVGA